MTEPAIKRAIAFIDGQNVFHSAKEAYGHTFPNYDVNKLAAAVAEKHGWNLVQVYFYTGIPDEADNAFWNHFWVAKTAQMGRSGVEVFTRSLRYRNKTVRLPDGTKHTFLDGEEKGIDVRIAVDVIRLALAKDYDVGVIFSQDQDLSEVADEIRVIAREQKRWIKLVSAFPTSPVRKNTRGINGTDWFRMDRELYDSCLDPRDYRPKRSRYT
jgi:uncharacterized LabA/DUF88 family protein